MTKRACRGMGKDYHRGCRLSKINLSPFFHGADPHARWCGGWGRDSPGYPISLFLSSFGKNASISSSENVISSSCLSAS